MPKLTVLVGPAGSGKTTYAKSLINDDGDHGLATVYTNQDSQTREGHLKTFSESLSNNKDIICDRMNFNKQQRSRYLLPAKAKGYETKIIVLHESYKTCFDRCMARQDHETIRNETNARSALGTFFGKYERPTLDEADEVEFVYPGGNKPSAIVCDLDGTLCNVVARLHFVRKPQGERRDWKSFFDNILGDSVNGWCKDLLKHMSRDHTIVYCSGRPDDRRRDTLTWLDENKLLYMNFGKTQYGSDAACPLYMRPRNDQRDDSIVKEIILDFEILTRFKPYFMIDDRKRVVDMWRKRGFTCLHCAEGDF